MTEPPRPSAPRFIPFPFGEYQDTTFDELDVASEIDELGKIFAQFGMVAEPWTVDPIDRDRGAVDVRLEDWSRGKDARDSIVYWVGHGWSNDQFADLAHAASPFDVDGNGVEPTRLARALANREASDPEERLWSVLFIDACKSYDVARMIEETLTRFKNGPKRYLVLGTSGQAETRLGVFRQVMDNAVNHTFAAEPTINLVRLAEALEERLRSRKPFRAEHGMRTAFLVRSEQLVRVPLDIRAELQAVLDKLTEDERRHFIPKAQSAETNELFWFFEGRESQAREIVEWLRSGGSGLLIVTGAVGSGKSALLGQLLAYSQPELRNVLMAHGLLSERSAMAAVPDRAFDSAILLTGTTTAGLIARLADDLRLGLPPAGRDLDDQVDWLLRQLEIVMERDRRSITVLVDALDEAAEPLGVAGRLLVPLSRLDGVRLVVGTRRSTQESPDAAPPVDEDIMEVLNVRGCRTVRLGYEKEAIERYVRNRLEKTLGGIAPDEGIAAAATTISEMRREFLYARLAVHELRSDPGLLDSSRRTDLLALLRKNYEGLLGVAVDRLTRGDPAFHALLEGLALAEGRGLPLQDGIWATIAGVCGGGRAPTVNHIDALLVEAAPYILLDREEQTVYRLAHRAFAEMLAPGSDRHGAIVGALINAVPPGGSLNPYVALNLAGHAARSPRAWRLIAERTDIVDRLDRQSLTVHALRTGLTEVPAEIAGVAVVGEQLARVRPADRPGWRQIGMAQFGDPPRRRPTNQTWALRWCATSRRMPYVTVGRHAGAVRALITATWRGGQIAVVAGGDQRAVYVWDAQPGDRSAEPHIERNEANVDALTVAPGSSSAELLVIGSRDGMIRAIDPAGGEPISWFGHELGVQALSPVPMKNGRTAVVSAGRDSVLRLWDPSDGRQIGEDWVGHTRGAVLCVCLVPGPDGTTMVVSGGTDGTLRRWDPRTGKQQGPAWTGHVGGRVAALAPVTYPDGVTRIISGGNDGTVRLWDPLDGTPVEPAWNDDVPGGPVNAVAVLPRPGDAPLIVSGDSEGTLRFWDSVTGAMEERLRTEPKVAIRALGVLRVPGRPDALLSAGDDNTVRQWDPTPIIERRRAGRVGDLTSVSQVGGADGRPIVVTGGRDGRLRLWDPRTGQQAGIGWDAHEQSVQALTRLDRPDGSEAVVSAGADLELGLWDPKSGTRIGRPWTGGHRGPVRAITTLTGLPRGPRVLSASADSTLRLWDPVLGEPDGEAWSGHRGSVWAVAAADDLVVSGSSDRTILRWDPEHGTPLGKPWSAHTGDVRALVILDPPDGERLVASAGSDGHIVLWDPGTGRPARPEWRAGRGIVAMAALPRAGRRTLLVYVDVDHIAHLWDPVERRELREARLQYAVRALEVVDGAATVVTDEGILAVDL